MTTGLSLTTKLDTQSYNRAVNTVNIYSKQIEQLLGSAYRNSLAYDDKLTASLAKITNTFRQLQKQIFINQSIINNFNASAPYQYPTTLLENKI